MHAVGEKFFREFFCIVKILASENFVVYTLSSSGLLVESLCDLELSMASVS